MSWTSRFFAMVLFFSFAELYLLILVAEHTGILLTIGMCILTGIAGGSLVRVQGIKTLYNIQTTVSRGEIPTLGIVSGLILLIIGAFLLTPGFITDGIAFLLLIPPLRYQVSKWFLARFKKKAVWYRQSWDSNTTVIDVDSEDVY
ncbi:MAG: exlusion protein FxsA [Acidobacteria bacterium]|nr:MAG: exlusion protein FxsA [Acidobacteriota bacterium]PIE91311.1 MAG: exlusion protein FxsA [Acidobacteriota bacterium]